MSYPPKPCAHCGNATLTIIPNVLIDIAKGTTVLGMKAVSDLKSVYWTATLVVCNQCGCTQTFTTNVAELAATFGASTTTVPYR